MEPTNQIEIGFNSLTKKLLPPHEELQLSHSLEDGRTFSFADTALQFGIIWNMKTGDLPAS